MSSNQNEEEQKLQKWEVFVADCEAKGICPFSGLTFKACQGSFCDCFRDMYPDDPYSLHPEAFTVVWPEAEGHET